MWFTSNSCNQLGQTPIYVCFIDFGNPFHTIVQSEILKILEYTIHEQQLRVQIRFQRVIDWDAFCRHISSISYYTSGGIVKQGDILGPA